MKAEKFEPGWLERDVKSAAQRSKELLLPAPEAVWNEATVKHAIALGVNEAIELCAKIADNYGREGDRLAKEFACEVAEEIAARLRALKRQSGEG